jgi:hypothetical protein
VTDFAEKNSEQFDLFEDDFASCKRLLSESVARLGLSRVADIIRKDPSTIANQLSGVDPSKRPSADLVFVCWLLDPEFRIALAKLKKEVISRPPDLEPEDALREIAVRAQACFDKRALSDVNEILARTARRSGSWEQKARAAGWAPVGER